jgi:hypothetical protein
MDNIQRDSVICRIVEEANILEKNYKEIFLQYDQVEQRIDLWRAALDLCETNFECTSCVHE